MSVTDFKTRKTIRQGDVFFIPVGDANYINEKYPQTADRYSYSPRVEDVENGIIQRGESTGHDHRLDNSDMDRRGFLKRVAGVGAFIVTGMLGARVVQASTNPAEREGVELHRPVDLEPETTYQAVIAREFDYANERAAYVRD